MKIIKMNLKQCCEESLVLNEVRCVQCWLSTEGVSNNACLLLLTRTPACFITVKAQINRVLCVFVTQNALTSYFQNTLQSLLSFATQKLFLWPCLCIRNEGKKLVTEGATKITILFHANLRKSLIQ